MKKLTAGIFATILGLTAIDAYAALPEGVSKVATTNYVDGAMGAAVTSAVTTANAYTDAEIDKIAVPDVSNFATTTYVDTQDAATLNSAKTYAESEADAAQAAAATDATTKAGQALTDAKAYTDTKVGDLGTSTDVVSYVGAQGYLKAADISGKADTTYVDSHDATTLNTAKTYADDVAAQAESDANAYTDTKVGTLPQGTADVVTYVNDKTSGIASDDELQALKTTVSGHTTDIDNLETAVAGKQDTITGAQLDALNSGIDATKVGQIQAAITNSNSALTQAETAADNALEAKNTATTANTTANEAKTAAANAQTTADDAVTTANAAAKDATDAVTEAQAATSAVATLTTTVDEHTTSINTLTDNKLDKSVYNTDKPTFALKTEVQAVDAKLANYVTWDDVDNSYGD